MDEVDYPPPGVEPNWDDYPTAIIMPLTPPDSSSPQKPAMVYGSRIPSPSDDSDFYPFQADRKRRNSCTAVIFFPPPPPLESYSSPASPSCDSEEVPLVPDVARNSTAEAPPEEVTELAACPSAQGALSPEWNTLSSGSSAPNSYGTSESGSLALSDVFCSGASSLRASPERPLCSDFQPQRSLLDTSTDSVFYSQSGSFVDAPGCNQLHLKLLNSPAGPKPLKLSPHVPYSSAEVNAVAMTSVASSQQLAPGGISDYRKIHRSPSAQAALSSQYGRHGNSFSDGMDMAVHRVVMRSHSCSDRGHRPQGCYFLPVVHDYIDVHMGNTSGVVDRDPTSAVDSSGEDSWNGMVKVFDSMMAESKSPNQEENPHLQSGHDEGLGRLERLKSWDVEGGKSGLLRAVSLDEVNCTKSKNRTAPLCTPAWGSQPELSHICKMEHYGEILKLEQSLSDEPTSGCSTLKRKSAALPDLSSAAVKESSSGNVQSLRKAVGFQNIPNASALADVHSLSQPKVIIDGSGEGQTAGKSSAVTQLPPSSKLFIQCPTDRRSGSLSPRGNPNAMKPIFTLGSPKPASPPSLLDSMHKKCYSQFYVGEGAARKFSLDSPTGGVSNRAEGSIPGVVHRHHHRTELDSASVSLRRQSYAVMLSTYEDMATTLPPRLKAAMNTADGKGISEEDLSSHGSLSSDTLPEMRILSPMRASATPMRMFGNISLPMMSDAGRLFDSRSISVDGAVQQNEKMKGNVSSGNIGG